eukprot:Pgem_evm1s10043
MVLKLILVFASISNTYSYAIKEKRQTYQTAYQTPQASSYYPYSIPQTLPQSNPVFPQSNSLTLPSSNLVLPQSNSSPLPSSNLALPQSNSAPLPLSNLALPQTNAGILPQSNAAGGGLNSDSVVAVSFNIKGHAVPKITSDIARTLLAQDPDVIGILTNF